MLSLIDPLVQPRNQTRIKHIRMGHFEFYVKFYVNFCNNIICSEHLTHAILDLVTSLIYFNGILLGKIATLNPIWQLLKHAEDLTVGVKHISDNQNEILLNRDENLRNFMQSN